jgi:DNA-binding NarL/FixJ family response regulator
MQENQNVENRLAPIRIFLVDDNLNFMNTVIRLFETDPRIKFVGKALTGREAVEVIPKVSPDLVLMDIKMPEMNGFEATRRLKKINSQIKIVLLTLYDSAEYRWEARNVCADGFIEKSQLNSHLNDIITYLLDEGNVNPTIDHAAGLFIE